MRSPLRAALGLALVIGAASPQPVRAGADLQIHPTRLVLEGRKTGAAVTLINGGDETGTYRVRLKDVRMDEDGTFETIPAEEAPGSAQAMLRHAPRQVTLAPGETQIVRVAARKPAGLTHGEYRSHLEFRAVPDAGPAPAAGATGLSMEITPRVGIAIPVIVRHGTLDAGVALGRAETVVEGARRLVTLDIHRKGDRSIYGDLTVLDGQDRALGTWRGVAVYTDITRRRIVLELPVSAGTPAVARFVETGDRPGGVTAEARLDTAP